MTSWIDAQHARKGIVVELLEKGEAIGYFKVMFVYDPPLSDEYIQMKQSADKDFKRKTDY
jgi:hypothetical protein